SRIVAPARAAQIRARWVLPDAGGPNSAAAGMGQPGQDSTNVSAWALPGASIKSERAMALSVSRGRISCEAIRSGSRKSVPRFSVRNRDQQNSRGVAAAEQQPEENQRVDRAGKKNEGGGGIAPRGDIMRRIDIEGEQQKPRSDKDRQHRGGSLAD